MSDPTNSRSGLSFISETRAHRRLACILALLCAAAAVLLLPSAQARDDAAVGSQSGQRDFDFEFGRWKTQLKVLRNPLSGSTTWVEYEGTTVVTRVWEGRANLVELEVAGAAGRIEGASWRLYNPQTNQWSLNFSNSRAGTLTPPVYGGFVNGRGEFYGQDFLDGRAILVRFVIAPQTPNTIRFEQAFSADGGKNWEVNWLATDTRIAP